MAMGSLCRFLRGWRRKHTTCPRSKPGARSSWIRGRIAASCNEPQFGVRLRGGAVMVAEKPLRPGGKQRFKDAGRRVFPGRIDLSGLGRRASGKDWRPRPTRCAGLLRRRGGADDFLERCIELTLWRPRDFRPGQPLPHCGVAMPGTTRRCRRLVLGRPATTVKRLWRPRFGIGIFAFAQSFCLLWMRSRALDELHHRRVQAVGGAASSTPHGNFSPFAWGWPRTETDTRRPKTLASSIWLSKPGLARDRRPVICRCRASRRRWTIPYTDLAEGRPPRSGAAIRNGALFVGSPGEGYEKKLQRLIHGLSKRGPTN